MSTPQPNQNLTAGVVLARSTAWNMLGQILPMAVGVVTVPLLIAKLGIPRFGVLSLAYIVVGYFSLVDLGVGRALTKLVADRLGTSQVESIPPLAWTAMFLIFILGVAACFLTLGISPLLVRRIFNIPGFLQQETIRSFYLLSFSIPLVTITSGFRGILEAQQQFRVLNLIRIPTSAMSFVGPLLVILFSTSLVPVVGILVLIRLAGCVAHMLACFHFMPELKQHVTFQMSVVRPILKLGGWMTVSNLLGPLIFYADRFVIAALLSITAVTYYTTPFDLIIRLTAIPVALAGVLFPAFAYSVVSDLDRTRLLLTRGMNYTLLLTFPVVLWFEAFAPEILRLWLGPSFASNSALVLRCLAVGVFINCLSGIPYAFLQGAGRADLTGILLLIDFPVSIGLLWLLASHFGIVGAAVSWGIRASGETLVLLIMCRRLLGARAFPLQSLVISIALITCSFVAVVAPHGLMPRLILAVLITGAYAAVSWGNILGPGERLLLLGYLGRFRHSAS